MTGSSLACAQDVQPIAFRRENFFLVPITTTRTAECLSLFHRYDYIYKPQTARSWASSKPRWRQTDTEMLKAIACVNKSILGARAGKLTRFAVLDIDQGSKYHTAEQLDRLIRLLMDAGLTEPVLYRSSQSDGWHLYIFFAEAVPSREVRRLLVDLLTSAGWLISKGTLEVFPSPGLGNSLGMGLRLPLQPGFAWLNSQTLEVEAEREWLTPQQAVDRFMDDLNDFGNDTAAYEHFKETVAQRLAAQVEIADRIDRALGSSTRHIEAADELASVAVTRVFRTPPPGINSGDWLRGRSYFETGLTGPSQRADAIFTLGHYLFYGDPERNLDPLGYGYEDKRRVAIERILALKNNGQSKDIARGRADALAHIGRAAHWRPAHRRNGTDQIAGYKKEVPIAWVRHNGNLKKKAIERIKTAMEGFVAAATPFTGEELAERANCSRSTLYKHRELWKPLQEELRRLRIEKCTDEYNVVRGAGSSKPGSPAQDFVEVCPTDVSFSLSSVISSAVPPATPVEPPGRLAARSIAEQLSRQGEKEKREYPDVVVGLSSRYALSWKREVEHNLSLLTDDQVKSPDVHDAWQQKVTLAVLLALVARAPDDEHQIWLQEKVQLIREKLCALQERFVGRSLPTADPESS